MPFWIIGALGAVRKALSALWALAVRYPLAAALVAALCLSAWLWQGKGKALNQRDTQIAGRAADRKAVADAQVEAARLALAAKAATEARYKAHAQEIDREHETQLADARSDVDRYIAASRVRGKAVAGAGSKAVASADNRDPGVPAGLPANYVPVAESDLRACAAATAYALDARAWALGLAHQPHTKLHHHSQEQP